MISWLRHFPRCEIDGRFDAVSLYITRIQAPYISECPDISRPLQFTFNPFLLTVPQMKHPILAKIAKTLGQKWFKSDGCTWSWQFIFKCPQVWDRPSLYHSTSDTGTTIASRATSATHRWLVEGSWSTDRKCSVQTAVERSSLDHPDIQAGKRWTTRTSNIEPGFTCTNLDFEDESMEGWTCKRNLAGRLDINFIFYQNSFYFVARTSLNLNSRNNLI